MTVVVFTGVCNIFAKPYRWIITERLFFRRKFHFCEIESFIRSIKYIQFNYSHDISIDDVAKSVGVSRSHLYRVFMLNVGKSPIDYLTEYRINEACKLLRAGNLSIAEVAVSVGFFDQFYFSRVFKRAKGVPPSKYFAAQADAPADGPDHQ